MLLTGTFTRSVDDKLRIAIPKGLRDCFASETGSILYVAPGTDGSLSLYPEEAFARLAERLGSVSPNARQVRDYSRLFYSQACRVDLDRQGRVRIPGQLAELAGLGKEAILLGVQDHLELWDQVRWKHYLGEKQLQYDEIAEAAFGGPGLQPTNTDIPGAIDSPLRAPK